jgi:hypothetical protein
VHVRTVGWRRMKGGNGCQWARSDEGIRISFPLFGPFVERQPGTSVQLQANGHWLGQLAGPSWAGWTAYRRVAIAMVAGACLQVFSMGGASDPCWGRPHGEVAHTLGLRVSELSPSMPCEQPCCDLLPAYLGNGLRDLQPRA